jgi:cation diffusion facilitator family transporter
MWITAAMMLVEIIAGWWFNSMALLADGWHMSSHAFAIGVSAFAYRAARRHASDPRFAFGTWKIEVLGGFASAVFLLCVAALMAFASIERLFQPEPIHYVQAIPIAIVGLVVNIGCAWILGTAHHAGHDHGDHDAHSHDHRDLNLKSAYIHVVADAATSVFAITALTGGLFLGLSWLDPVMGLVGAAVVASWARGLLRDTSRVLLDREMDHPVVEEIRREIAMRGADSDTRIADLHVWRVGRAKYACALCLVTHDSQLRPHDVRRWLGVHDEIAHATIEIHVCA